MYTVLIVIHTMVTIALIGIILIQRNSTDMGLSSSSSTSFMSGRAAATFVTRATAVLAAIFILLSLAIGILTAHTHTERTSIMDKLENAKPAAVATPQPAAGKPASTPEPVKPANPAVPHPE